MPREATSLGTTSHGSPLSDFERWIDRELAMPVRLAHPGMPLFGARIDHLAVALPSLDVLREHSLRLQERGHSVLEPVAIWPDAWPECPVVPDLHRKWMETLDVGPMLLVLLAPASPDDLIARCIAGADGRAVHHVAYEAVGDGLGLDDVLGRCERVPGVVRLSGIAQDPALTQVFLRDGSDPRIVELVRRAPTFSGTFRCGNIAALTYGEEVARPGSRRSPTTDAGLREDSRSR